MKTFTAPVRYLVAALGAAFVVAGVFAAAFFFPDSQPTWSPASFTLQSTDLKAGATKAYRPWFENGAWQGDVIEYNIAMNGTRTLGSWTARGAFTAKEATVVDYWKAAAGDGGRKIITGNGDEDQLAFRWDTLTDTQRELLDPATSVDYDPLDVTSWDSPKLNYVRGDRSSEKPNGLLRQRYSLLGDIINSRPVYVGAPASNHTLTGYAAYKNANLSRAGRVYVGANDGMIHAFDASDGHEVYAYVPSMLMHKLGNLSRNPYLHNYYADGEMVAADVNIDGTWKTVLAGGLGAGEIGLFVLDVSDPDLSSETAFTGADKKVLYEDTGDIFGEKHLGHVYGRPRIALLPDDKWYVVSGNGFGSDNGEAELYMLKLRDGGNTVIKTGVKPGNGLAAPGLVDEDSDGVADIAYAGDLLGNLWKFDLEGKDAYKLFAAGVDKPITTAPDIARHPMGGFLVYFGTGSVLSSEDHSNTDQQSVYAIWDKPGGTLPVSAVDLRTQTLTEAEHADGARVRVATANAQDWSLYKGWQVDLPGEGERVKGIPQLRGGRLQFVSDNPEGESWLIELNWLTGGDSNKIFFDLNANNALDVGDNVTVGAEVKTAVALYLGDSTYSQPTFARVATGTDIIFINGLTLPESVEPTVVGSVIGGLQGGHFDVDTDLELGDSTDDHTHQYDDSYDTTLVDYYAMEGGHAGVNEAGIPPGKKFVVVLANSDLSPGGVLTIKNKDWNVVDYQEMVQQKLEDWDGSSPLLDDDGDSLTYSLNEISAAAGTIRISFNDRAIIDGGLIGTATGCVKGNDAFAETGRYRNGALTMHLLDYVQLNAGNAASNIWIPQNPIDLVEGMQGGGVLGNFDDDSGFLFESTIFWHYSGDCYGEDGWAEDFAEATATYGAEQLSAMFPNYAANADAVNVLLTQLFSLECEKGKGLECDGEDPYKDIEEALKDLLDSDWKEFEKILNRIKLELGPSTSVENPSTGTPGDVLDASEDLTPAPGPNFGMGRRTWIDLHE